MKAMSTQALRRKSKKPSTSTSTVEVHDIEDRTEEFIEEKLSQDVTVIGLRADQSSAPNSYSVVPQAFCNDFLFKVGDIVSLQENGCTYYAQIRVLVEDLFSEKYATLIWLLPTSVANFKGDFNPYTFTYGPQDEWFYSIRDISFVMHPPTDFYKRFITPVPKNSNLDHVIKYKFKRKS